MSFGKRGQIATLTVGHLLLAFIVIAIMVIGVRAIIGIRGTAYKAELASFKATLSADMETMSFKPGAVRKFTYSLPNTVEEVCFADLSGDPDSAIGAVELRRFPIVYDSVHSKAEENVFVLGESLEQSYYVGPIQISGNAVFTCSRVVNGKLEITVKGTQSKAMIVREYKVTQQATALEFTNVVSSDGAVTLGIPPGAVPQPVDISIEIIPQDPNVAPADIVSETYKFGPSGTRFATPIKLTLKYDPRLLGEDCPNQLLFYQYDDNGNLVGGAPMVSDSVDCGQHTATFSISSFSWGYLAVAKKEPVAGKESTGASKGAEGLSELQTVSCQSAHAAKTCGRLADLGLVSAKDCCSKLRLCCSADAPGLSELQVVACQSANAAKTCARLPDLGLVSAEQCCASLKLCCQTS
jgi:hypothetical protein